MSETVEGGWNVLVGADKERILAAAKEFEYSGRQRDVFGDGDVSGRINNILKKVLYDGENLFLNNLCIDSESIRVDIGE